MLLLSAAGKDEDFRPTSLLESGLSLLLGAVELHHLGQRHLWLELDAMDNTIGSSNNVPW